MTTRTKTTHEAKAGETLSFCSNCHVSISEAEVKSGGARRTATRNAWCTLCARAGADGRRRRRAVLEEEFADDAPISAPAVSPAASPADRAQAASASPPHGPSVDQRVGHLERAVFQLQARVQELESLLAAEARRSR